METICTKNIRVLLTEGFTDQQLRLFCYDDSKFRSVYNQFAQSTGKEEVIQKIIEHAERNGLIKILLDWAETENPDRYKKHQPYYIINTDQAQAKLLPQGPTISLKINKDGLIIEDEQELKASLVEALFAAESQTKVTFDVILEPLEVIKEHINSIESNDVSSKNRIIKVSLQRQAMALEARYKILTLALSLFLVHPLQDHFLRTNNLIESIHGLARLPLDFQRRQGSFLGLAIFRKKAPKLNTVIWIDETEQEEIKTYSGSDNMFVILRIGCDLWDLSTETRFRKAIPAIVYTIASEAIKTGQDIHNLFDLSKVLDLGSWTVGLH